MFGFGKKKSGFQVYWIDQSKQKNPCGEPYQDQKAAIAQVKQLRSEGKVAFYKRV